MKRINDLAFPEDVRYTENHEWARQKGDNVQIGITDFAQDQLGDIVYAELPEVGTSFARGDEFSTVESVKAVAECYMPLGGKVVSTNSQIQDNPEIINQDPYGQGWLVEIEPQDQSEMDSLLDKDAYLEIVKGEE